MDGFKFYEDLFKLGEVYPCIVTNKIMMHDNIKTGGYEVIIKGNKGIGFIDSGLIADGFENLNIDDEAEFIVCGFDGKVSRLNLYIERGMPTRQRQALSLR